MSNKPQAKDQKRGHVSSTTPPILPSPALLPNDDDDFDEQRNEAARKLVKWVKKRRATFKRRTAKEVFGKPQKPLTSSRPKRAAAKPLPEHVFNDSQEDDDIDALSDNPSQSLEKQDDEYDMLSDEQSQTVHQQSEEDSLLSDNHSQLLQQS